MAPISMAFDVGKASLSLTKMDLTIKALGGKIIFGDTAD